MVSAASAAASEELAAGAGVAHGAERAGEGRPGGGVVVLGGGDGEEDVADLRQRTMTALMPGIGH